MIKPRPGYILIETEKKETKTNAGFYMPESAEHIPLEGTVVESGVEGIKRKDVVIFKKWMGTEYKEYQFIKEEDILGVIS